MYGYNVGCTREIKYTNKITWNAFKNVIQPFEIVTNSAMHFIKAIHHEELIFSTVFCICYFCCNSNYWMSFRAFTFHPQSECKLKRNPDVNRIKKSGLIPHFKFKWQIIFLWFLVSFPPNNTSITITHTHNMLFFDSQLFQLILCVC